MIAAQQTGELACSHDFANGTGPTKYIPDLELWLAHALINPSSLGKESFSGSAYLEFSQIY